MKIGIIGLGVVGQATEKMIKHYYPPVYGRPHILKYDPDKAWDDDMLEADIIFICVPAPTKSNGEQDLTAVRESLKRCRLDSHVFIRTSVLPGTTLALRYGASETVRSIHALPEFLTERRAEEDAVELPLVCSARAAAILRYIIPNASFLRTDSSQEAELVKYVHNCFAAVKVGFFNLVHRYMMESDMDQKAYDRVVTAACGVTGFIEPTHTQVPGPDGQKGFGGKCLPKDLFAFSTQMEDCIGETFLSNVFKENFFNRFGSLF